MPLDEPVSIAHSRSASRRPLDKNGQELASPIQLPALPTMVPGAGAAAGQR